ncbi:uncharacterized protein CPUR_07086 [Claviceps purpurea 20.1]|uniref:F-box domain-containing protein n=1 Tax=Claviceps purpurea (strain 20.1) TaxID=1111077 RepID=M1VXK1_CLAP2|nr:uncharacterized protein CPUR_07086 [Claviceps purpurea 20.1]
MGPGPRWRDKWDGVWPHLKVLIFGTSAFENVNPPPGAGLRQLICLNRGNSLLHLLFIGISFDSGDEIRDIFGNDHDTLPGSDVIRHSDFRNLRSVRSHRDMWILPDRARILLSNSIENRQLTSFDIVFPERDIRELYSGDLSVRHLKGYDWLRGAPSIHTLGCYGFRFRLDLRNDDDLPLPQFLATFPNLRTLKLDGQYYGEYENDFASVILAIMSVTRLKTIYTTFFQHESYALGRVRDAAQFKGVQILIPDPVEAARCPEQWPMPLEP